MATTKLKIRNDLAKKSVAITLAQQHYDTSWSSKTAKEKEKSIQEFIKEVKPEMVGEVETTIYVQYTYNRKIKLFNTGKKIQVKYWDEVAECVKRAYKGYTTINSVIQSKQRAIDQIVSDLQLAKKSPTLEAVEREYELSTNPELHEVDRDFFKMLDSFIKERSETITPGTIRQFRNTYNHLKAFEQEKRLKITLEGIDLAFYDKFKNYLQGSKQLGNNTIGKTIKNLKTFLNYLTERGINTNTTFRHRDFKKLKADTDIIYLSNAELQKLIDADLRKNERLDRVRDLFVFACATGLRYSDISNLKLENIKEDHIDFTTVKTRDRLVVPFSSYARAIIEKYDRKLPKAISNQKMNSYLKELGKVCGINEPVHYTKYKGNIRVDSTVPKYELMNTHTARRTFITQSLERGLRPEVVMKFTGHKDVKTMMKYVKITEKVAHDELLRAWSNAPSKIKAG